MATPPTRVRWAMPSSSARLRANPTDAEIRLWARLRRKEVDGFRFRRQHPMWGEGRDEIHENM